MPGGTGRDREGMSPIPALGAATWQRLHGSLQVLPHQRDLAELNSTARAEGLPGKLL